MKKYSKTIIVILVLFIGFSILSFKKTIKVNELINGIQIDTIHVPNLNRQTALDKEYIKTDIDDQIYLFLLTDAFANKVSKIERTEKSCLLTGSRNGKHFHMEIYENGYLETVLYYNDTGYYEQYYKLKEGYSLYNDLTSYFQQ